MSLCRLPCGCKEDDATGWRHIRCSMHPPSHREEAEQPLTWAEVLAAGSKDAAADVLLEYSDQPQRSSEIEMREQGTALDLTCHRALNIGPSSYNDITMPSAAAMAHKNAGTSENVYAQRLSGEFPGDDDVTGPTLASGPSPRVFATPQEYYEAYGRPPPTGWLSPPPCVYQLPGKDTRLFKQELRGVFIRDDSDTDRHRPRAQFVVASEKIKTVPYRFVLDHSRETMLDALKSGQHIHAPACLCQHCDACAHGPWDELEANRWLDRRGREHAGVAAGLWAVTGGKRTGMDRARDSLRQLQDGLREIRGKR